MKYLRKRALSGEVLAGAWLNLGSSLTAEMAGRAGFDWAELTKPRLAANLPEARLRDAVLFLQEGVRRMTGVDLKIKIRILDLAIEIHCKMIGLFLDAFSGLFTVSFARLRKPAVLQATERHKQCN